MKAIIDSEYLDIRERFVQAKLTPLCGFLWLEQNRVKEHPEQKITIFYNGQPIFTTTNDDKPTKKAVKAIMDNCRR